MTQFAAAALIVVVSALCLIPRDVRATRGDGIPPAGPDEAGEAGEAALSALVPPRRADA